MQPTTYKIAEQIGEYGFFGSADLKFRVTKDFGKVNISNMGDFARWQPGILFGAIYFLEHVIERIGLELEITSIEHNDVDTNNTVIAYVVFQALMEGAKIPVKRNIVFDKELKSFIFPK